MSSITPQRSRTFSGSLARGLKRVNGPRLGRVFVFVFGISLAVTMLWTMIEPGNRFGETLRISLAIGFCIWGVAELTQFLARGRVPMFVLAVLVVPVGFVLGCKLAAWTGTDDLVALLAQDPAHQWRNILASLMTAAFGTTVVVFYARSERLRADLQSERRQAAEALQSETSAQLALLQAQIEPHFLFNTLANVSSVVESDPKTAKTILEHLNHYLRVSLGRTRRASATLADEIDLVHALLAIAALRLGDRLRYSISVPEALATVALPPLLLQPLVENALEHGIEPALKGGEIHIVAERHHGALVLSVRDTGVGLDASSPEGVGLANVRARLASLYGARGRLALYRNAPQGVVAELTMPSEGTDV
jgi:signal transduction histidine kinase